MAASRLHQIATSLLLLCYLRSSSAVLFSSLHQALIVTASPRPGQVLHAGVDQIRVSWALNGSLPAGAGAAYAKVKISLCYAPVSQADRRWRKTRDDLKKDKTCQFKITTTPYASAGGSYDYAVERSIPTATYFVRAYALDSSDVEVAYGQTTDAKKTTNLFDIIGISGRHASLPAGYSCYMFLGLLRSGAYFLPSG